MEIKMIIEVNSKNIMNVNKSNESFNIFGRIIPEYKNNCWNFSEELLDIPYEYKYSDDNEDYSEFINNPNKTIYFYYSENICIGQIIIRKYWNKFTFIQDISVLKNHKHKGIGHLLMDKALDWTKESNLNGMMLETQDVNVAACRFYKKYGFILGGVDTMLYSNFENADQKALFWYYKL
jgi:ribosomal protein S18 acetylase RimI-like enzyme